MRRRVLILPLAAIVITALCAYKLTRRYDRRHHKAAAMASQRLAPSFELYDQNSQLVKFERYVGRHRILVVFFDGEVGADQDPHLRRLRTVFDRLDANGTVVVGISGALPQENRRAMKAIGGSPFPLLTDLRGDVHRQWGCWDEAENRTRPGLFFVDRRGLVSWSRDVPQPVADFESLLQELLDTE